MFLAVQLLELVEKNELNRSLLALLDENIATAQKSKQVSVILNFILLSSKSAYDKTFYLKSVSHCLD